MLTLKSPFLLIDQLKAIATQADRERLSPLVDQFAVEYPELYNFISDLVDLAPGQAVNAIIKRWPVLAVLRVYPEHEQMVEMIQSEIKARRNHHGRDNKTV